nr:SDR family NAD(P)-dependent oxidoreductase [uncultured Duganella sp.]
MFNTIILTGGTNGLGRLAARSLARPGVRLVLVARDASKAAALCSELSAAQPDGRYDYVIADFSRLETVAAAGVEISRRFPRIDVLINNAGIHAFSQRVTPDGFSEMVSTNYLAPWLLTAHLRQALIAAGGARVVTVASQASRAVRQLDPLGDLRDTKPFSRRGSSTVYAKTKLMNIMFSAKLARCLAGTGVAANCLDPGFNVTGLGRELPGAGMLERALTFLKIGDPGRGAAIIVRLATQPEFQHVSGGYFSRDGLRLPVPAAGNERSQAELWDATERLLVPFDRTLAMRAGRAAVNVEDACLEAMQGLLLGFHNIGQRLPAGNAERAAIERLLDQGDAVIAECVNRRAD